MARRSSEGGVDSALGPIKIPPPTQLTPFEALPSPPLSFVFSAIFIMQRLLQLSQTDGCIVFQEWAEEEEEEEEGVYSKWRRRRRSIFTRYGV